MCKFHKNQLLTTIDNLNYLNLDKQVSDVSGSSLGVITSQLYRITQVITYLPTVKSKKIQK